MPRATRKPDPGIRLHGEDDPLALDQDQDTWRKLYALLGLPESGPDKTVLKVVKLLVTAAVGNHPRYVKYFKCVPTDRSVRAELQVLQTTLTKAATRLSTLTEAAKAKIGKPALLQTLQDQLSAILQDVRREVVKPRPARYRKPQQWPELKATEACAIELVRNFDLFFHGPPAQRVRRRTQFVRKVLNAAGIPIRKSISKLLHDQDIRRDKPSVDDLYSPESVSKILNFRPIQTLLHHEARAQLDRAERGEPVSLPSLEWKDLLPRLLASRTPRHRT